MILSCFCLLSNIFAVRKFLINTVALLCLQKGYCKTAVPFLYALPLCLAAFFHGAAAAAAAAGRFALFFPANDMR